MVGVGIPIEVQESLSDPPSSTDKMRAWFALVEALTALIVDFNILKSINFNSIQ